MHKSHPHPRILLLSTVHSTSDPRIAGKIAPSLSPHFDVFTALSIHKEDDRRFLPNRHFIPLPYFRRLLWRLLLVHPVVLWKFLFIRPRIVHIFVAELLPLAFIFRWLGAEVIYEVQENLYKKLPLKSYNRSWVFEYLFRYFDHRARRLFKFVFTEDAYLNEYRNLQKPYAIVHNFAASEWLSRPFPVPDLRQPAFFYAGVISFERAFDTMMRALVIVKRRYPTVCLHLFGHLRISPKALKAHPAYPAIHDRLFFHGYVSQTGAFDYAGKALAGIALLKPVGDYADSYPTKLFDYMALGLPVITSDLPLLKAVVEPAQCGFCVSPYDADALADVMIACIEQPEPLRVMGENGRKAVKASYNWEKEAEKLVALYLK
ncbi:glycosyltransferase [Runella slithyformis]|uniref:Glycosyl transferase group 1 n=1 Tax=Runella slithyformis (strain ATCC 29530 / DSM 19594 / LMG 11500 / NCIMB 11436 / LSU 4) TaxID=761193 RepID=A0A7U4E3Y9_RUNSL|nr:glycosyltransferase [Runella slithyformis]AEI46529.1 glycosyl transferase group 1 [Runella slithyformis DSM 19594]